MVFQFHEPRLVRLRTDFDVDAAGLVLCLRHRDQPHRGGEERLDLDPVDLRLGGLIGEARLQHLAVVVVQPTLVTRIDLVLDFELFHVPLHALLVVIGRSCL